MSLQAFTHMVFHSSIVYNSKDLLAPRSLAFLWAVELHYPENSPHEPMENLESDVSVHSEPFQDGTLTFLLRQLSVLSLVHHWMRGHRTQCYTRGKGRESLEAGLSTGSVLPPVIHCWGWVGNPEFPPLSPAAPSLGLTLPAGSSGNICSVGPGTDGCCHSRSSPYWNHKAPDEGACSDHWGPRHCGQDIGGLVSGVPISDSEMWESCRQE